MAIAFLMFPAAIFLMRRFSIGIKMRDTGLKITRTIVIENIPPLVSQCTAVQGAQQLPRFAIQDRSRTTFAKSTLTSLFMTYR